MKADKSKRLVAGSILIILLLVIPIFEEVYYTTLYYTGIILLIPITIYRIVWNEKFERRFYNRWQKVRKQKYWIKVSQESLLYFVFVTVVVTISQFFGNGLTPLEIVSKLTNSVLSWILLLLLFFSLIVGIVACYEKEKRYKRIYYKLKYAKK